MTSRRAFIRLSAVGGASLLAPNVHALGVEERRPIVISTWDFGLQANKAAWKILSDGGRALDAVEAGARVPEIATKRADILTTEKYGDFELVFDWKIAPGDNSGVIYRATEEFDQPYLSGPEYQVIDDKNYSSDLTATQTTASNYDMHAAPADKKINPPGEWNSGRIVARGNHIEHWLNGEKLIEYEIGSADWNRLKEGSKWKNAKGYGMADSGHIDLQDHGGEVWYRNIKIKPL